MPRNRLLTELEKGQILAYNRENLSLREIGRRINRSHIVVRNFLSNPSTYGTKRTGGPKKKLSRRAERRIIRVASNSMKSLKQIQVDLNLNVSKSTVHRVLKSDSNVVRQKLAPAPRLLDRHKVARLDFAQAHMGQNWCKVRGIVDNYLR